MVLCIIALPLLLVLSIFSAKYRPFAKRAMDCVFKAVTLRPCESGLDEEIKAKSIAGLMKVSPSAAGLVNRHFEAVSLVFTLLLLLSAIWTVQGIYNFVVYGNCNGPQGGFCVYSGLQNALFLKSPTSLDGMALGNVSANVTVVEFGCYTCPYTKAAEPMVQNVTQEYGNRIYYVFKDFPLASDPYSKEAAIAASCANEEGAYWQYRAELFAGQADVRANGSAALGRLAANLNLTGFDACYSDGSFNATLQQQLTECSQSGIYGTPTFFVNGQAFVGPTAANDTQAAIEKLLGVG